MGHWMSNEEWDVASKTVSLRGVDISIKLVNGKLLVFAKHIMTGEKVEVEDGNNTEESRLLRRALNQGRR